MLDRLAVIDRYLHADAALSGKILPFVGDSQHFRFSDGLDSIAVSGHKMIGSPLPCGIVLARREHVAHLQEAGEVEYVRCTDTTIASSRSAFTPPILYHALGTMGVLNAEDELGDATTMKSMVRDALSMAEYAILVMRQRGIPAWRHANSYRYFPEDDAGAREKMVSGGKRRDLAHDHDAWGYGSTDR